MAAAEQPPIADRLIAWGRRSGRRDLPWQNPASPYRVWVSEVMLQQTRVGTVVPYFERFLARFPTLAALASAALPEVLACWAGLGYYARARNLHDAARRCLERHGGELPESTDELAALPGIGRSTAGAIAALAGGLRAPILDGNAKRVLARYHGVPGWPGSNAVARELWRIAERETPEQEVGLYTQSLMDLGAILCTRRRPCCDRCPLALDCAAHRAGDVERCPAPRPPRARPTRTRWFAWVERDGRLLLERRPPSGVWGGLLCLPELPANPAASARKHRLAGLGAGPARDMPGFSHDFTHFRLNARVTALAADGIGCAEDKGRCWVALGAATKAAVPAPIRSYIQAHGRVRGARSRRAAPAPAPATDPAR